MLNRNESNFLIKLYRSIRLLTMIRIKKLPVLCLISFINIQVSNINVCAEEANVKDILIRIKDKNEVEIKDNGIINNLGYDAKLKYGKRTKFTINNLEYNGIRIANKNCNNYYGFSNLKLNGEGKLKGKYKNGDDVPENKIVKYDMLFYANVTIGNKIINTFIRIIPEIILHIIILLVILLKGNHIAYVFI
ncbi:hypothetical protein SLOPH_926 [Spraguea lophii 42_110]|uniref:Uncharacterized protein n=1 Tax=Spraguea lophii (strain 42_110) TaxID=1358809 RepID=S7W824_SPRLO|nr:hypothetical protein SLOPH_926 [Spraguea lophii 42_110]